jgi:hypothetical protein
MGRKIRDRGKPRNLQKSGENKKQKGKNEQKPGKRNGLDE